MELSMRHRRSAFSPRRLMPAVGFLLAAGCEQKHPEPLQLPPPVVQVAAPVERVVTEYAIFTARTQTVQSIDIKARVTGYLTKIAFKDGSDVQSGQVLFEIDNRPYKAALDKAKADVEVAKATQIKNQAFYDIGLTVQKQDPNAISAQELDRRKGDRDESTASVQQALASLESAQLNFDWCKVTAPITGRINNHQVDVGDLVTQDQTVMTNIVSLKPVWAYFNVDQNTVEHYQQLVAEGKLQSARKSEIPVSMGLGSDRNFPFNGVIDFIANQLDPNTGSVRVRAIFPNKDQTLSTGYFGRVKVPISGAHSALLVSDQAVGVDQGQNYVLVVNEKNVVEQHIVDVGQLHDGLREVRRLRDVVVTAPDGVESTKQVEVLRSGDRIIVNGLQRVRPGATVQPSLVDMTTGLPIAGESGPSTPAPAAKSK
jgi:RND family efflux transporter MFP subunit